MTHDLDHVLQVAQEAARLAGATILEAFQGSSGTPRMLWAMVVLVLVVAFK